MKPYTRIPEDDNYVTGRDFAQRDGIASFSEWVKATAIRLQKKGVIDYLPTSKVSGKVKAAIDFERWIVFCPDPSCNGAEAVELDDPFFFCLSCGNAILKGDLYEVEFPDVALRLAVYEELDLREQNRPPNRNKIQRAFGSRPKENAFLSRSWHPHESPKDLKKQRERVKDKN